MLEKQVEARLVKRVKDKGGVAYKFVSPAHRGVSDRVIVMPGGVVWFVELKQEGGRLSPLQKVFADDIKRLGANYICLYGAAEVDAFCEGL